MVMDMLRLLLVLLVVVLVQVFGALDTPLSSEEEVWTVENWQDYPQGRGIIIRLSDITKRSKSQAFHGLMGRSSGTLQPVRLGRKRNKGDMFVGLMGKRGLGGDNEEDWKSY
ncbi:protachykinin-1-like [Brachionichthys hirsutus]|uniref:protachykinin-1-like n=1 Tax=Brachionichthys hirsutus TaxID=412623 RepID=UPI003604E6B0